MYSNSTVDYSQRYSNWWVLSIAVDGADITGIRGIQKSKLANAFEAIYSKEVENKVHLYVEVVQSKGPPYLMAEQLQELFVSASKLGK